MSGQQKRNKCDKRSRPETVITGMLWYGHRHTGVGGGHRRGRPSRIDPVALVDSIALSPCPRTCRPCLWSRTYWAGHVTRGSREPTTHCRQTGRRQRRHMTEPAWSPVAVNARAKDARFQGNCGTRCPSLWTASARAGQYSRPLRPCSPTSSGWTRSRLCISPTGCATPGVIPSAPHRQTTSGSCDRHSRREMPPPATDGWALPIRWLWGFRPPDRHDTIGRAERRSWRPAGRVPRRGAKTILTSRPRPRCNRTDTNSEGQR